MYLMWGKREDIIAYKNANSNGRKIQKVVKRSSVDYINTDDLTLKLGELTTDSDIVNIRLDDEELFIKYKDIISAIIFTFSFLVGRPYDAYKLTQNNKKFDAYSYTSITSTINYTISDVKKFIVSNINNDIFIINVIHLINLSTDKFILGDDAKDFYFNYIMTNAKEINPDLYKIINMELKLRKEVN